MLTKRRCRDLKIFWIDDVRRQQATSQKRRVVTKRNTCVQIHKYTKTPTQTGEVNTSALIHVVTRTHIEIHINCTHTMQNILLYDLYERSKEERSGADLRAEERQ